METAKWMVVLRTYWLLVLAGLAAVAASVLAGWLAIVYMTMD